MKIAKQRQFDQKCIKVAHIIREKDKGGIRSTVFPLVNELQSRGFIFLVLTLGKKLLTGSAKNSGVQVKLFKKKIGGFDPFMLMRIAKVIKKEKVNLIHTHSIGSNFYGRLVKVFLKIPVITTVHADTASTLKGIFKSDIIGSILFHIDTSMARYSDTIIAVSNALREKLIQRGIRKEKIIVIHNGIATKDKEEPGSDALSIKTRLGIDSEKVVGTVGRLTQVKNHALFLKCAKVILVKNSHIKFLIIGDGPLKEDMEKLAQDLGIKKDVIFTGWSDRVQQLYKIMDVFVLTSHMEGMPVTLLEAMSNRLPVVATRVGGIPEVIENGKTGYLCPPDDPEALASAIYSLLDNPLRGQQMGLMGSKVVGEKFSINAMADAVSSIYRELFNRQKVKK